MILEYWGDKFEAFESWKRGESERLTRVTVEEYELRREKAKGEDRGRYTVQIIKDILLHWE